MDEFKSTLIDLPENDDTIECPECDDGIDSDGLDRDGHQCYYCDGKGVVSERHYNDIKSLERDEQDL